MFYDNLKAECERQGLKITPIVLECGGNKGSLTGWRKGASPNSNIVVALATRLNVSTDYLLLGKEHSDTTISHSTVEAVGNHSSGTVTITNAVPSKKKSEDENLCSPELAISENAKELLEVFESLPKREQIKLLSMVFEFEEKYRTSNK